MKPEEAIRRLKKDFLDPSVGLKWHRGKLHLPVVNPVVRTRLYSQIGFRFVDFEYVQPSLEKGQEPADALHLIMMPYRPEWVTEGIAPEELKYLLMTYMSTWAGLDMKKDETILEMKSKFDALVQAKKKIRLLTYQELGIPHELVKKSFEIFREKEGKNAINN